MPPPHVDGLTRPLPETEAREAIERFYRDGYAIVRGVLGAQECDFLCRRMDEIAEDPAVRPQGSENGLFILRDPERRDAAFARLFIREPILSLVRLILGPECRFCAQNVIRSRPGHAISHWHVDDKVEYPLPPEMPRWDARARLPVMWMSVQMPLSDVMTLESGPTEVVAGSQFSGRLPANENPVFEGREAEPVFCRAGDIYLFNHQVWHRGRPNVSQKTRYLMQLQYGRGDSIAHRLQPAEPTPELEAILRGEDPALREVMLGPAKFSAPGHFNRM